MSFRATAFSNLLLGDNVHQGYWLTPSNLEMAFIELDLLSRSDRKAALDKATEISERVNAAYRDAFGSDFNPVEPLKQGTTYAVAHLPRLAQMCHLGLTRIQLRK